MKRRLVTSMSLVGRRWLVPGAVWGHGPAETAGEVDLDAAGGRARIDLTVMPEVTCAKDPTMPLS
jgi:hypothetical protein